MTTADLELAPLKSRGAPGVALADFDGDGDLDLYVTNGPGTPNSLFLNQLADSGELRFEDTGLASGAGATDQDSRRGEVSGTAAETAPPRELALEPL